MQTLLIPIEGVEAAVEAAPKPNDSVDAVVAAEPNVGAGVTAPKRPPDDAAGAPNICNHTVLPHEKITGRVVHAHVASGASRGPSLCDESSCNAPECCGGSCLE